MLEFTRKVVDVKFITTTTEKEIKRKENTFKNGGSDTIITISRITKVRKAVFLECGHFRTQENGMRDITKQKKLICFRCEENNQHLPK